MKHRGNNFSDPLPLGEIRALNDCVDDFAVDMRRKLRKKAIEGSSGWDDPWTLSRAKIIRQIKRHLRKGDMVDVANLAMFAWNRQP